MEGKDILQITKSIGPYARDENRCTFADFPFLLVQPIEATASSDTPVTLLRVTPVHSAQSFIHHSIYMVMSYNVMRLQSRIEFAT